MDQTFRALADPTRRAILTQVALAPSRVTELAAPHAISLNSISKHLRVLESAGLIQRQVRGREHWFEFKQDSLLEVEEWISDMLEFWNGRFEALERYLDQQADNCQ